MHRNGSPVRDDPQLREWLLDPFELLAQRFQCAPDLPRLDVTLAQFDQRLEGDQVGERIGFGRRYEVLLLPASKLALGEAKLTADVRARVFLIRGHASILTAYPWY